MAKLPRKRSRKIVSNTCQIFAAPQQLNSATLVSCNLRSSGSLKMWAPFVQVLRTWFTARQYTCVLITCIHPLSLNTLPWTRSLTAMRATIALRWGRRSTCALHGSAEAERVNAWLIYLRSVQWNKSIRAHFGHGARFKKLIAHLGLLNELFSGVNKVWE